MPSFAPTSSPSLNVALAFVSIIFIAVAADSSLAFTCSLPFARTKAAQASCHGILGSSFTAPLQVVADAERESEGKEERTDCDGNKIESERKGEQKEQLRASPPPIILGISIERVRSKKRTLDVKVFRGFSMTSCEYIENHHQENQVILTEAEAIDRLMPGYDSKGEYIKRASPHEREVQFVAIYDPDIDGNENADPNFNSRNEARAPLRERLARQNNVVGVVSTQIRFRSSPGPAIATVNVFEEGGNTDVSLLHLSPHVYLSNLRVDDMMRRKGVGSALIHAVMEYTSSQHDIGAILLSVDNDNAGAIELYHNHGFAHQCKNEEYGTMFLKSPAVAML